MLAAVSQLRHGDMLPIALTPCFRGVALAALSAIGSGQLILPLSRPQCGRLGPAANSLSQLCPLVLETSNRESSLGSPIAATEEQKSPGPFAVATIRIATAVVFITAPVSARQKGGTLEPRRARVANAMIAERMEEASSCGALREVRGGSLRSGLQTDRRLSECGTASCRQGPSDD